MNQKDVVVSETRKKYFTAVLEGDQEAASRVINNALQSGVSVKTIYSSVFMPVQNKLGDLWLAGEITVSQEHAASQITLNEMGRVRSLLKPKPRIGLKALVGCAEGDNHFIGARVVADFLYCDGWDVEFLGDSTPVDEFKEHAQHKKVDLVGISVLNPHSLQKAKETCQELGKLEPRPKIVVGGGAVQGISPEDLGADEVSTDVLDGIDKVRQLFNLPSSEQNIELYLKAVGGRIAKWRKTQHMSQQQVSQVSGLDRAYISAVEHGKHNVTLGAVMKLAEALEVTIEDLLFDSGHFESKQDRVSFQAVEKDGALKDY